MTTVLFEPHHDDAVLFACYTLLRVQPHVVTVLSRTSDPSRRWETESAMECLGLGLPSQWDFPEKTADWDKVGYKMQDLDGSRLEIQHVWAPLVEDGGHEDHNEVGRLASEIFAGRVSFYATYRRGFGRTRTDTEVIPEPDWSAIKFRAMSCYSSQINLASTRPWFAASDMLREWVV